MFIIKSLLICLIVLNLNAMQKDIIYIEDDISSKISLKNEFLNPSTEYYTLTLATFDDKNFDAIDFFKNNQLNQAIAYRYGKNKNYIKIISGIYKNGTLAQNDIKNLSIQIQNNKPYSSKLFRHSKRYYKYSDYITSSSTKVNQFSNIEKSIYIDNNEYTNKLKEEFLNKDSKYYSIALGSIYYKDENLVRDFIKKYNLSNKILAHVYGKNKDKIRIIYGLYKSRDEANNAIKNFNYKVKSNRPFTMKINKFRNFYTKYFPLNSKDDSIVELRINDSNNVEKVDSVKLSNDIKIIEHKKLIKKTYEKKIPKKEKIRSVKKLIKKIDIKRTIKKSKSKSIKKIKQEILKNKKFVKDSILEDVYFLESKDNFNILNEVFLNEGSSFYTIDLGEIELNDITIEEFFKKNNLHDNTLAYKYGDNKEYGRIIYGAYETKEDANNAINFIDTKSSNLKVSNIKNHQNLYKVYHKEVKVQKIKNVISDNYIQRDEKHEIVYVASNLENNIKNEFFNKNSKYYTITLLTILQDDINLENFLIDNELYNNVLVYSIGSAKSYYRIIYGLYKSSNEAKKAINRLNENLKNNAPYVSKIITNQKKFESYNNRALEEKIIKLKKIKF